LGRWANTSSPDKKTHVKKTRMSKEWQKEDCPK
jgi:hypothetical protein